MGEVDQADVSLISSCPDGLIGDAGKL